MPWSALVFLTGLAALLFETTAIRLFAARCSGTVESLAVVVATFLVALGVGSACGGAVRRPRVARLAFVLVTCSAAIAMFIAPWIVESVDRLTSGIDGVGVREIEMLRAALGAAATVLPVGLLLGAAFPLAAGGDERARTRPAVVAFLSAANNAGAVAGAALAGFVLFEELGLRMSCAVAAAVAALAGALATRSPLATLESGDAGEVVPAPGSLASPATRTTPREWFVAAALGFALLAAELLGARLLFQYVAGSSIATACVLIVFLLGLASGNALAGRVERVRGAAAFAFGAAALAALAFAPPLLVRLARGEAIRGAIPVLVASSVLVVPAVAIGAAFAGLLARPAAHVARRAGSLLFANGVGSTLGAGLATFVLLPAVGMRFSIAAIAALLLAAAAAIDAPFRAKAPPIGAGAVVVLLALLLGDARALPDDPRFPILVAHSESGGSNVTVMRSADDPRPALFVNRVARQGGGTAARRLERRQGLLPAALLPNARTALVLGIGTGATAEGIADAGVQSLDAVELVPGVIDALPLFRGSGVALPQRPGVRVIRADAVDFARRARAKYDLVVGDPYFPWVDGVGALYSLEHFEAVRDRLAPGGLFCQWVPLHRLRFEDFGLLARTFRLAFPETLLFLCDPAAPAPVVALVGSVDPIRIDVDALTKRLAGDRGRAFREVGFATPADVVGLYLGDRYSIDASFTGKKATDDESVVNRIDRPLVEFRAAKTRESETVLAVNNFDNLARELGGSIEELLVFPADWDEERVKNQSAALRRRVNATAQFVRGHFWNLRVRLYAEDPLRQEELEAEAYVIALSRDPTHPESRDAVAAVALRRLADRRYQQVVALTQAVLRVCPDDALLWKQDGIARLLLDELTAALGSFERAAALEPGSVDHLANLMVVKFLLGDDAGSRAALASLAGERAGRMSAMSLAVASKLRGDDASARTVLRSLAEDPVWGSVAQKLISRLDAPADGNG